MSVLIGGSAGGAFLDSPGLITGMVGTGVPAYDATNWALSTRSAPASEPYTDQLVVSGSGVIMFLGFNAAYNGSVMSAKLIIDGVTAFEKTGIQSSSANTTHCHPLGGDGPIAIPFKSGFTLQTRNTNTSTRTFYVRYGYRLS